MLAVIFPGNAKFFFQMVLDLLNFKFVNVDGILSSIGLDGFK